MQEKGDAVTVAGRIGNIRKAGGKLRFCTLFDRSRAEAFLQQRVDGVEGVDDLAYADAKKLRGIQLYLDRNVLSETDWEIVRNLNLADWVESPARSVAPRPAKSRSS